MSKLQGDFRVKNEGDGPINIDDHSISNSKISNSGNQTIKTNIVNKNNKTLFIVGIVIVGIFVAAFFVFILPNLPNPEKDILGTWMDGSDKMAFYPDKTWETNNMIGKYILLDKETLKMTTVWGETHEATFKVKGDTLYFIWNDTKAEKPTVYTKDKTNKSINIEFE